jgi:hypothetical protein
MIKSFGTEFVGQHIFATFVDLFLCKPILLHVDVLLVEKFFE